MRNSTVRGVRGKVEIPDSPLPELSMMDILQERIKIADQLIALKDLPETVRLAEQMKARALAEIQELITAEPATVTEATAAVYGGIEAHVSASYGQAGEELGTRWIVSGGGPYEIAIGGISSPSWWNSITEEPF